MKYTFLFLFLLDICYLFAQNDNWQFTSHIISDNSMHLTGQIEGGYNITMHLYSSGRLCGKKGIALRWKNWKLRGWYYYDKYKKTEFQDIN